MRESDRSETVNDRIWIGDGLWAVSVPIPKAKDHMSSDQDNHAKNDRGLDGMALQGGSDDHAPRRTPGEQRPDFKAED